MRELKRVWSLPRASQSQKAIYAVGCVGLSALFVFIDYVTGPLIEFEVTFVIPVCLAVWFSSRAFGLTLAFLLPVLRLYYVTTQGPPWTLMQASVNAAMRVIVLMGVALVVDLARKAFDLAHEVEVLKGILPLCSVCKKVRNDDGTWQVIEHYVSERSRATFSTSMCPDCAQTHYPETFNRR